MLIVQWLLRLSSTLGSLGIREETVKYPMEALDPAGPQEVLRTLLGGLRIEASFSHHKLSC